jgi:hypothetical protein
MPTHEIKQHPRDNDLILAIHARGIWILDDLTPVQQWAKSEGSDAFLFDTETAVAIIAPRGVPREAGLVGPGSENGPSASGVRPLTRLIVSRSARVLSVFSPAAAKSRIECTCDRQVASVRVR